MVEKLGFGHPATGSIDRPWIGWLACAISISISLCVGVGAIKNAYEFRQFFTKRVIADGRTSKDLVIDRDLNAFVPPIYFGLAVIGCVVCWRRRTGRWLAVTGLSFGVAGWIVSFLIYP